jgi:hypothetical protein
MRRGKNLKLIPVATGLSNAFLLEVNYAAVDLLMILDHRCDFTACCKLGHFERVNEVQEEDAAPVTECWGCVRLDFICN